VLTVCVILLLDNTSATEAAEWGLLAYLSAEGGLEADAERYWHVLLNAASAGTCDVAVQIDGAGAAARWAAAAHGDAVWAPLGPTDMTASGSLTDFLAWAAEHLDSRDYALIVLGHGSGLATLSPERSGIATDGGSARSLGVAELAGAIDRSGLAPLELVSLEACYGSSLEVAWALRDVSRYMVGSPGEVCSPGLPWADAIRALPGLPDGQALGRELCLAHDGPLVCVDLGKLDVVCERLAGLTNVVLTDIEEHSPSLRLVRSRTRSWGYRDEMCDAAGLAALLGAHAATVEAADAAVGLRVALEGAVCARSRTLGDSMSLGVGLFFPATWEPVPAGYAGMYELAADARWGELLEQHYRASGRDLIR